MFLDEDHVSFRDRPQPQDSVWRYMDITKFLALLEDKSLHFARADLLFDKWEGGLDYQTMEDAGVKEAEKYALQTFTNYISSWHVSEYESTAMWDIYQREGRGVAIRTTWDRLTASLQGDWIIRGGRVNYVDYSRYRIPLDNQYSRFMYKRQSFDFEKEARLVFWAEGPMGPAWVDKDGNHTQYSQLSEENLRSGYNVPVDLEKLVQFVYVAPDFPSWMKELMTRVIGRYEHDWPIVQSDLGANRLR
jgi:hypothetical protein